MRDMTSAIRWQIFKRNCAYVLTLVVVFWGIYLLSLFGITFASRGQRIVRQLSGGITSRQPGGELITASVVTLLGGLHMGYWSKKAAHLARRGELISGTVRRLGGLSDFDPWRRIDFSYTYNGKAFARKMWGGEKRERGTKINLLVDPTKPGRVMFACDVLPLSELPET